MLALAAGIVLAPAALAEPWVVEYPRVGQATSAACRGNALEECRAGLVRLGALTDGRPDFRCRLARVDAALGQEAAAVADLSVCLRSGLAFATLATEPAFVSLRARPEFLALVAEAERLEAPALEYRPRFVLAVRGYRRGPRLRFRRRFDVPQQRPRTEDHPARTRWHDQRLRDGGRHAALGRVRDRGRFAARHPLGDHEPGAASPPFAASEDGMSAVLKFDLHSHALLARYELDDGRKHGFGDVTLGANGSLIVADGIDGGV